MRIFISSRPARAQDACAKVTSLPSIMSDDQLLLAVCEARIRDRVVTIIGYDDEVIIDMILRHVLRCAMDGEGEDADIGGLTALLAILVGDERAATLSNDLLAEPALPPGAESTRVPFATWPFDDSIGPLPVDDAARQSALSADGPLFGTGARGVEVRTVDPSIGQGVFATRPLRHGELVGVYIGERLTFNSWWTRHGAARDAAGGLIGVKLLFPEATTPTGAAASHGSSAAALRDRAAAVERHARLEALKEGSRPLGGANNGGAYVFKLPPGCQEGVDGEPIYCIDAEDPNRSTWCRYLNHAPSDDRENCNVEVQIDARGGVWFVVSADCIQPGAELRFDYGLGFASKIYGESMGASRAEARGCEKVIDQRSTTVSPTRARARSPASAAPTRRCAPRSSAARVSTAARPSTPSRSSYADALSKA